VKTPIENGHYWPIRKEAGGEEKNGMIEAGCVLAQQQHRYIDYAHAIADIEHICEEYGAKEEPPEVFLVSSRSFRNSLLAVRLEFLESGQLLACPGLPLVGAAFDPDWGYARVEIVKCTDGSGEFREPTGQPDTYRDGDVSGYRLCPIDNHEIPDVITQLAHIRAELAKPRQHPSKESGIQVTLTQL
jgi:hypothetical protein